jgi:hypothetical protein
MKLIESTEPVLQKLIVAQPLSIFQPFMEANGSALRPQEAAISPNVPSKMNPGHTLPPHFFRF